MTVILVTLDLVPLEYPGGTEGGGLTLAHEVQEEI